LLEELGCEESAGGATEALNRAIARFATRPFDFKIALAPAPRR